MAFAGVFPWSLYTAMIGATVGTFGGAAWILFILGRSISVVVLDEDPQEKHPP